MRLNIAKMILIHWMLMEGYVAATFALQISTTGNSYIPTGISLTGIQSLVFQVKSVDVAQLAILTTPNDYTNDMIEIVLRSGNSENTTIRHTSLGPDQSMATTANMFQNGTDFVWMWVSWSNNRLTIGTGDVVGKKAILVHNDVTPIRAATTFSIGAFSTGVVDWIIPYDQKGAVTDTLELTTSSETQFLASVGGGCQDVGIGGSLNVTSTITPHIFLQNRTSFAFYFMNYLYPFTVKLLNSSNFNEWTVTFKGQLLEVRRFGIRVAYDLLNASLIPPNKPTARVMPYWMTWSAGMIVVGRGLAVGKDVLIIANPMVSTKISVASVQVSFVDYIQMPFIYFVGLTNITRVDNNSNNSANSRQITLQRIYRDQCLERCVITKLDNPSCKPIFCASFCVADIRCTAFFVVPRPSPGQPCSCRLQWVPMTPMSTLIISARPGSTFWLMIKQ